MSEQTWPPWISATEPCLGFGSRGDSARPAPEAALPDAPREPRGHRACRAGHQGTGQAGMTALGGQRPGQAPAAPEPGLWPAWASCGPLCDDGPSSLSPGGLLPSVWKPQTLQSQESSPRTSVGVPVSVCSLHLRAVWSHGC